ncbi:endonuclease/exonuclease/phosphatase family protein [Necator americanus]|uniref:Endonuclease/exonuclease/phosphatase family protein n=1 Tax=Necator americanus TaxID=51031 RepID=W2SIL0_NECAM|nr:endonuclease/exonuclease/phosphatase family protein [Necator americanus]ETN69398.1 endonuclease/exonuclease/phosphatase family protein [Necator americanus]
MAICTYNVRTLASEAAIEDLMMRTKKIKYDVIGLTEMRRRHTLNAVYETGKELFLGTCDSRGVGGVGVLVNTRTAKNIDSFEQLTTPIGRLRMRRCGPTPALTIFVAYAPTSSYEEEEVEAFYMDLEKFYREDHAFYKVIIDFNAKVGPRRTPEELHIGTHGLQWNDQGERLSEFIMTTKTIHGNSQFQKPSSLRWTWESPGGGYRNEIDHIIVNKRFCLTDVAVVPKFNTGSDHRLLRGRFSFTRRAEKAAKFRGRNPRAIINWDLFATLAGFREDSAMDNIDEEYDRLVEHLHDCAKKAESFKTTNRRLSLETLELIRQRGAARAAGNQALTSELARLCREAIKEDPKERRAEVLAEAAEAALLETAASMASIPAFVPCLVRPYTQGAKSIAKELLIPFKQVMCSYTTTWKDQIGLPDFRMIGFVNKVKEYVEIILQAAREYECTLPDEERIKTASVVRSRITQSGVSLTREVLFLVYDKMETSANTSVLYGWALKRLQMRSYKWVHFSITLCIPFIFSYFFNPL